MNVGNFFDQDDVKPMDSGKAFMASNMDINVENDIQKTIKKTAKAMDTKDAIYQLMLSGINKAGIKNAFKTKYAAKIDVDAQKYMDDNYGIMGFVCVDCSKIKDLSEYSGTKYAFKKFHKYAMSCACDQKMVSTAEYDNAGSMDGFLSENKKISTVKDGICAKTSLHVIKSFADIKDADVSDIVMKISSLGHMTVAQAKDILAKNSKTDAIKKAFEMMNDKAIENKYIGKVDTKAFQMKKADFMFDVANEAKPNIPNVAPGSEMSFDVNEPQTNVNVKDIDGNIGQVAGEENTFTIKPDEEFNNLEIQDVDGSDTDCRDNGMEIAEPEIKIDEEPKKKTIHINIKNEFNF